MDDQEIKDRRSAERFQTLNLLSYCEMDPDNIIVSQGIAKTIDLSESGALIEIPKAFINLDKVECEIALEEKLVRVSVEVIEQQKLPTAGYQVRLRFRDLRQSMKHRLMIFIQELTR